MSLQRKQIIMNEIAFWKKNRLLPEHYCDFLLALYAQGENQEDEQVENASKAVLAKKQKYKVILYSVIGILTALLLASMFVVTTAIFIPIILVAIAILSFLYIAIKLVKNKSIMAPLLFVFSALLLLALSFKVWDIYFGDDPLVLIGLIFGNCLLWLFSGLLLKLVYFSISGILGLLLIIGYFIFI
ncbi:hypothetical protein KD050_02215 [Psychrobacillus sp. INOP01]|uniref:hypothetical protein n=1 Tax=Psychrobacillus sp. INOP01 TaxID=2829187 RepID=UPI001BAB9062|nr:hypothetical protein [Psychrobacillus sp. INOP01]QUG42134.1 hypothetical protein KD050_02215 [Psychrobacillus sp. INOP01]